MIEQKLMTNLALIALSSIKINWFYQKIQSKYNRRKFQNFVFGPILEFGKIWFISVINRANKYFNKYFSNLHLCQEKRRELPARTKGFNVIDLNHPNEVSTEQMVG